MAEQFATSHCGPCASRRVDAWQHIAGGRLRWEESQYCPACGVQACDGGWGPAPQRVRARIVAQEGTVRLAVGGPDGVPLKAVREVYALSLPQLREARAHGVEATPVEAELLRGGGPRAAGGG